MEKTDIKADIQWAYDNMEACIVRNDKGTPEKLIFENALSKPPSEGAKAQLRRAFEHPSKFMDYAVKILIGIGDEVSDEMIETEKKKIREIDKSLKATVIETKRKTKVK